MSAWSEVATESAKLKREQLYAEIGNITDERMRANLFHTYYKLFMFLDEDLERLLRCATREQAAHAEMRRRMENISANIKRGPRDLCLPSLTADAIDRALQQGSAE